MSSPKCPNEKCIGMLNLGVNELTFTHPTVGQGKIIARVFYCVNCGYVHSVQDQTELMKLQSEINFLRQAMK